MLRSALMGSSTTASTGSQTRLRAASSTTTDASSRMDSSIRWRGAMLYRNTSTSAIMPVQPRAQAFSGLGRWARRSSTKQTSVTAKIIKKIMQPRPK